MSGTGTINTPGDWAADFPRPLLDGNKYDRGHAAILASPELTGATRLAAQACSRIGAGLVTVVATERADVYRTVLPADIMVRTCDLAQLQRVTTLLAGSGGISSSACEGVLSGDGYRDVVLDAGALDLTRSLSPKAENIIVTPHEGEFASAFPEFTGSREIRAQAAAAALSAIVVLKGHATLIASPNGQLVVNTHSTPYLAKAGTGDVLAGFIAGLLAQGMDPFQASCAAVWIYGETAKRFGPGLVASDLQSMVPAVLKDLNIH